MSDAYTPQPFQDQQPDMLSMKLAVNHVPQLREDIELLTESPNSEDGIASPIDLLAKNHPLETAVGVIAIKIRWDQQAEFLKGKIEHAEKIQERRHYDGPNSDKKTILEHARACMYSAGSLTVRLVLPKTATVGPNTLQFTVIDPLRTEHERFAALTPQEQSTESTRNKAHALRAQLRAAEKDFESRFYMGSRHRRGTEEKLRAARQNIKDAPEDVRNLISFMPAE